MLTVYKASAGSGKTYTLAYEYIKLLLGKRRADGTYVLNTPGAGYISRPHARILAITFTNKATAEMKSRILKELDVLARMPAPGHPDSSYAESLSREFRCSRTEIRDAAARALRALLNDYGAFNVSTIDSFFQTILRSFAREIDRQGDYRLELDEKTALAQSMSMLFDEVNLNPSSNKEIAEWLREQAHERMLDGKDYNPFNRKGGMYRDIVGQLKKIFDESFASREKEMNDYLADPQRLRDFKKWIDKEIRRLKEDVFEPVRRMVETGAGYTKYLKMRIDKIFNAGEVANDDYGPIKNDANYIVAIRERDVKKMFAKGYKPTDNDVERAVEWLDRMERCWPLVAIYTEISHKVGTLWALYHIYRFIDRFRVENNLILISDSNPLLKTIIDGSDAPFIYERVGMTLENFLIDEFQDTSRMQWGNLRPLVGTSIETADSLIIGDEKQSIYRWRGADPDLLARKVSEHDFPRHSEVMGSQPGENTNYRSAHDIVRFNNTLFDALSRLADGSNATGYEGVGQALPKNTSKLSAWIRVANLTTPEGKEEARKMLDTEEAGAPEAPQEKSDIKLSEQNELALKLMAETIMGELRRGYRQSDIAILCRKRETGTMIAEYLGRNYKDIKLVSEESLLLRNSKSVKLIVSMLEIIDRSLEDPEGMSDMNGTKEALAGSTLFNNDDERERMLSRYMMRRRRAALADTFGYHVAKGEEIETAISLALKAAKNIGAEGAGSGEYVSDISNDLAEIRALAPSNIAALVQAVIKQKISEEDCRLEMPYISSFVDLVDEFMRDYTPSLHSFLTYWHEKKDKLAVAPGVRENAVTISTVHKAKGLEWACVHIPLMNWEFSGAPRDGWYDMSALECPDGITPPPIMYLDTNSFFDAAASPLRRQYMEECELQRLDNLNVAYVAFTRAVRELHVTLVPKQGVSDPLWKSILNEFAMPSPPAAPQEIYLEFRPYVTPAGTFELGGPTEPLRTEKPADELPVREAPRFAVSFNAMNRRLTRLADMTYGDVPPPDDDSDLGNETERNIVDRPLSPQMERAARAGIIMHSILSRMDTVDDLDAAVESHRRDVCPDELLAFRSTLEKAFEEGGGYVARWFGEDNLRVLAEQSIYDRRTGRNTRADRIVWRPDGSVEVVDYKFTSSVDNVEHYNQVRGYALALQQMGYGPVRAYLWYPLLNRIIEVEGLALKS